MARTVRNAKLDTRSARAKLSPRSEPYWCSIAPGRALGYRRLGPQGGTWIAKLRTTATCKRRLKALGLADDVLDAGGDVLTFAAAQEKAREWFSVQERGESAGEPAGRPSTVADALDAYLAWYARHRKALAETKRVIEAHIRPALGKLEIAELSTHRIRRWHEDLAAAPARLRTGRGKEQRHRERSDDPDAIRARQSTANRILTVLKAVLNHAYGDGKATGAKPEAWGAVRPFRGADAARVRWLQEDECRQLLNACPEDLRRLVHGALTTGCRYGELCRAEVRDFNQEAGALLIPETKSGKPRWVPLDDGAVAFLEAVTAGRGSAERVFLRSDGKPWGKSHQARPLLEACAAARIHPPASFHVLRHTWASHRVMKGAPLIVVAQVLGHSDTRMVEKHYGHLAPSFVRDAVRATALELGPHEPAP